MRILLLARWLLCAGILAACGTPGSPTEWTGPPPAEPPMAEPLTAGPPTGTSRPEATALPTQPAPEATATASALPESTMTPTPDPDEPVSGEAGQAGTPGSPGWQPRPGDEALTRGPAHMHEAQVLVLESFPPQIRLRVSGMRPTPCHELRVAVAAPDALNRIDVQAYTVVDPNMICVQVLAEFEEQIPLGPYPTGTYTVWVNGELAGEFSD